MKKILTLIIALLTILHLQAQTSYYVDGTNGSDDSTGTSLSQAWKTIQNAFEYATPGSTVYILGGTYYENVYANVSGTAGNPITYRNYQNDVVIIDGTGTPEIDMLYIEDQSNLIINNITVQNKMASYATGVTISCTASASVDNIVLHNLKITSINWSNDTSAIPTSNDNSNPLLVAGTGTNQVNAITNIIIDSCEVFNNITGFSEAISIDGNIDSFIVSNNKVHDNKNIGIDMAGNYGVCSNSTLDHARNGHCYNNTCYKNVSSYATSAGIYVDGGQNIIIERNTLFRNGWGIEIGCEENGATSNIIVRDNVIYNNKQAGLAIGGYTTLTTGQVLNSEVLNNTFLKDDYSNSGTGEIYMTKMSSCKIQNNVFYTNAQNILITKDNITPFSGNSINYNCWYTPNNNSNSITVEWGTSTYTTFSNYISSTGMEANSTYANPEITDINVTSPDFHLLVSSTCIDNGDPSFVTGTNETDFYGGTRLVNLKVDIGANEYPTPVFLNEYENDIAISVYPNPSNDFITIDFPQKAIIEILNIEGQVLETINCISKETTIDLENYSSGIYLIKAITDTDILTKKFIKE